MTISGTCHFISHGYAMSYYKRQGLGHDVKRKIAEKEIAIGCPPKLDGWKIRTNEGRYVYTR